MSVVDRTRYPKVLLFGSLAFFALSIGIAWPDEPTKNGPTASSVQTQREQAIAEAKARGEKTYTFRSSFNPNNPGGQ